MPFPFRAAALSAAFAVALPALAGAEDVTLISRNGTMTVVGTLLGYDGEIYRVETKWGPLTVEAEAVDCEGPGCPDLGRLSAEITLGVEPWLAEIVLLPRLKAYAEAEGLEFRNLPTENQIELNRAGKTELRLQLIAPSLSPETLLAEGKAQAVLTAGGRETKGRLITRLPLTLVSGPDAPQGAISLTALRKLRQGPTTWAALDLGDRPLVWHTLAQAPSLTRALGTQSVPQTADTFTALATALQRDAWGLALIPYGMGQGLMTRELVSDCGFLLDRSPLALASGDDPLSLEIIWREAGPRLPAAARRMVRHLTSAPLGTQTRITPQPLQEMPSRLYNALTDPNPELSRDDLRQAVTALSGASRLPHTLRLGPKDSASEAMREDLISRLNSGLMEGYELLIVGFTGQSGDAAANRRASETAAQKFATELQEAIAPLEHPLRAVGLGEALPLHCNTSPEGEAANTRLELWLRPLPPG